MTIVQYEKLLKMLEMLVFENFTKYNNFVFLKENENFFNEKKFLWHSFGIALKTVFMA